MLEIKKGIIVIPDFSGFTKFVFNTEMFVGEYVVKQLLGSLIESNKNYFQISEIEGDAILFYSFNKLPSYSELILMLSNMLDDFNRHIIAINKYLNNEIELSLKFIVHYGIFSEYSIGKFKKLYGKPVIEAHKFLKNKYAEKSSYILFSNSYLRMVQDFNYKLVNDNIYIPELGLIYYFK